MKNQHNKNDSVNGCSLHENAWLSRYMYLIILYGLIVAIVLLLAGFLANITSSSGPLVLNEFEENTISPEKLAVLINGEEGSMPGLLQYAGIFCMIIVPVAGIIFSTVFFARSKKHKLMVISILVLAILALSAIIGFMKQ
jgi:uncharacterized membrane protein